MPPQSSAQVPADSVWRWQDHASCSGHDVMMFYHPGDQRGRTRRRREVVAKSICFGCPVRLDCADYAIRAREPYGVWGGLTEAEREAIYASIPVEQYPRLPGDGASAAKLAIERSMNPQAFTA
ncbi:unannotated protein [freshwater metagenome]|uniref:Unannotated protein n=1 Tax=freshwater metagenome TaxID=449393 RepID=A0A6J7J1S2_9ZZZZ